MPLCVSGKRRPNGRRRPAGENWQIEAVRTPFRQERWRPSKPGPAQRRNENSKFRTVCTLRRPEALLGAPTEPRTLLPRPWLRGGQERRNRSILLGWPAHAAASPQPGPRGQVDRSSPGEAGWKAVGAETDCVGNDHLLHSRGQRRKQYQWVRPAPAVRPNYRKLDSLSSAISSARRPAAGENRPGLNPPYVHLSPGNMPAFQCGPGTSANEF